MLKFSELDTFIIAKEIEQKFLNNKVIYVFSDKDRKKIFVQMNKNGEGFVVNVSPKYYYICLRDSIPGEMEKDVFTNFLKGKRLIRVDIIKGERLIYLKFYGLDPLGRKNEIFMAVELTGKHSNVLLIKKGRLVGALKWMKKETGKRIIAPGEEYKYPPKKPHTIFKLTDPEYLKKHFPHFYENFKGDIEKVKELVENWDKHLKPSLYKLNDKPVYYSPFELENLKEYEVVFTKDYSQAIIEYFEFYENLEKEMRESGSSEKKEKNIEEEIKKFEKKIGEMEKELFKYKLYGETLMANLNKIQKGEKYVVLKNVYNPEETLNIELDETLTPQENAERYFEKYKKIKRGIEKLREKIENLKKKEIIIAKAPLNKEENIVQKEIRKHIRGVRVFTSPNGFKVYVAKGAKTADYLTFKIASPEDYFFHIKDSPGAHVILKCGKQEPSEEDIKFCAELALYYSKKRNSEKGIVSYAKRKYVKKFPEAKPGEVKIEKEKTINVRLNTFFIDS